MFENLSILLKLYALLFSLLFLKVLNPLCCRRDTNSLIFVQKLQYDLAECIKISACC